MAGEAGFSSHLSKAPPELFPNRFALGVRFSPVPRQTSLAGEAGFEPTNDGVKVRCLTAWLLPTEKMGWDIRFELMTSSATNSRPNQLGQSHHILARCGGLSSQQQNSPPDCFSRFSLTLFVTIGVSFLVPITHLKKWRAVGDSNLRPTA